MAKKKTSTFRIVRNLIMCILAIVLVFILANIVYLGTAFSRIPDKQDLEIPSTKQLATSKGSVLSNGITYKALSFNAGFCAYTPSFSFFMDGGSQYKANSKEEVTQNANAIASVVASEEPDFVGLQEVDSNADRTFNVDQTQIIKNALPNYNSINACCYNSPYLFWPPWNPYGKQISNIMSLSIFNPLSSIRRQLPIEETPSSIIDYDRCYTTTRFDTNNGKDFVWYNATLSSYADDPSASNKQIEILIKDMQKEFDMGNYVVCACDFNKQIIESPQSYFPKELVKDTKPFPYSLLSSTNISLVAPFDPAAPVGSCRSGNTAYGPTCPVANIDGFLISPNIKVIDSGVINTSYAYSDHNPVYLSFRIL